MPPDETAMKRPHPENAIEICRTLVFSRHAGEFLEQAYENLLPVIQQRHGGGLKNENRDLAAPTGSQQRREA